MEDERRMDSGQEMEETAKPITLHMDRAGKGRTTILLKDDIMNEQ